MSFRIALSRLVGRCRRLPRPEPRRRNASAAADAAAPSDDERPQGCGWFDSSFELRRGLAVVEHGAAELAVAIEWMFAAEAPIPGPEGQRLATR